MNKKDIILMAQKAQFFVEDNEAYSPSNQEDFELTECLERFAVLVASAERDACAKLAMTIAEQGLPEEMPEGDELLRACEQIAGGVLIADAIRARGQA